MSPDGFHSYMIKLGAAKHVKFRRLTIPERYAFFLGVLSIAAAAPVRGRLLVGSVEATPEDIAHECGVSVAVARSAMTKLETVGMLERDGEPGLLVHDFDDHQPRPRRPKPSDSPERARERKARSRAGHARDNGRDQGVTARGHAPEVEGEVEGKNPPNPPTGGTDNVLELRPPNGRRRRDREQFEQRVDSVAARLFPGRDIVLARQCVEQAAATARRQRKPVTDETIRGHAETWFPMLTEAAS